MAHTPQNHQKRDEQLWRLIEKEKTRQQETLDLIPSENICPPHIREILATPLVNKYTEGYAGARYYPGCENYDEIERLAISRALSVFGLQESEWAVNVQALSGSPANAIVYFGLMKLGETLMGLRLDAGGHLTHGHKVSFTGIAYTAVQYGVDQETELLDYDQIQKLADEHKPAVIISGTTAYPRFIDFKRFGEIAKGVGAYHVADVSHVGGLIVAGAYPSSFEYADVVMMTTHKTLRGPRGALIFIRRNSEVAKKKGVDIVAAINKAAFPGMQGGPHNNQTAAIAAMLYEAATPEYKKYQQQIVHNAKKLAESLMARGAKLFTGGTDCHMMLADMKSFGLDGATAENLLSSCGIIANRNTIPGDPSPFKPSGIRAGTPTLTSRGMGEAEMETVAELMHLAWTKKDSPEAIARRVKDLCSKFPIAF